MLLTIIQTIHTLITNVNFAALFYMIYMHLAHKRGRSLKVAYGLILVECVLMVSFKMVCPLRVWVTQHYSAATPDQILLNNIAPYYLMAGSTLLVIAIATYFLPTPKPNP